MKTRLYDRRESEELRIGRATMFKILHNAKNQPDLPQLLNIGGLAFTALIPAITTESFISIPGINGSTIRGVLITVAMFSFFLLLFKVMQWRHGGWQTIESMLDTLFSKRKI